MALILLESKGRHSSIFLVWTSWNDRICPREQELGCPGRAGRAFTSRPQPANCNRAGADLDQLGTSAAWQMSAFGAFFLRGLIRLLISNLSKHHRGLKLIGKIANGQQSFEYQLRASFFGQARTQLLDGVPELLARLFDQLFVCGHSCCTSAHQPTLWLLWGLGLDLHRPSRNGL